MGRYLSGAGVGRPCDRFIHRKTNPLDIETLTLMAPIILILQIGMVIHAYVRTKAITPGVLICVYIIAAELIYFNGSTFFDEKQIWPTLSYRTHPERNLSLYAGMFVLFYTSTFGYRRGDTDMVTKLNDAADALIRTQLPALVIVAVIMLLHFASIDQQILWSNSQYMLLRGPESITLLPSAASLIQVFFQLAAMVATLYAAISTARGRILSMLTWAVPATWGMLFFFMDGGRSSLVLFVEFFLILILLARGPGKWIYAIIVLLGSIFILRACLAARSDGSFGLMALPQIMEGGLTDRYPLSMLIGNLFEGVFVTGDSLDVDAKFDSRYALLSFSPLPSAIDGFDALLNRYQIRLFVYIPMSGLAEAIKFGPLAFATLAGSFWLTCWVISRYASRLGSLYLLLTFGVVNSFIIAGAYPVRNVFRQLLIWLTIALLVILIQNSRARLFSGYRRRPLAVAPEASGDTILSASGPERPSSRSTT